MFAYANPAFDKISEMAKQQRNPEAFLGDGYGLVRFNKKTRETNFECWPRYADVSKGDSEQYPGWPITFKMEDNDGRKVFGYLPEIIITDSTNAVVQVINERDDEILYTMRTAGKRFKPHVYASGRYTIKVGFNKPDDYIAKGIKPAGKNTKQLLVTLH